MKTMFSETGVNRGDAITLNPRLAVPSDEFLRFSTEDVWFFVPEIEYH